VAQAEYDQMISARLPPGQDRPTALSELGFPLADFDDFFAVVAHRQCHWSVCVTRPAEMDVYEHLFTL
jgi:hypothetical protein